MPLPPPPWIEDHGGGCRQLPVSREAYAQKADHGAAQEGIKVGRVSWKWVGPLLLPPPSPPRFVLIILKCL